MDYIFSGGEKISVKDISRKLELIEEVKELRETREVIGGYLTGEGRGKSYFIHPDVEKKYKELSDLEDELIGELKEDYGMNYHYGQGYHYRDKVSNIIYGDDYKITIQNGLLTIKDYDENQELEAEISIRFSEEELKQLVELLSK